MYCREDSAKPPIMKAYVNISWRDPGSSAGHQIPTAKSLSDSSFLGIFTDQYPTLRPLPVTLAPFTYATSTVDSAGNTPCGT